VRVVCLTDSDRRLLAARFAEHANSHRRMRSAFLDAGVAGAVDRLDLLRRLEHSCRIDLGSVCHRFERRDRPETHPIERLVMNYIAQLHHSSEGAPDLWILLDRVEAIRELMEGRLVGEPGA
jgi:hypothetical protein